MTSRGASPNRLNPNTVSALKHRTLGRPRLLHAEVEIGERGLGEGRLADNRGQHEGVVTFFILR
jgi:hypothetical protein